MATFVIVHGGWGGGWEWTEVARALRRAGHEVLTPTLTGMGERAHLARDQPVGLATHIEDVVAVLRLEDLEDVVLCGHSYGGMPVTGAADRCADRISLVVYIDALVPRDGQSALDLLPASFGDLVRAAVAEHGERSRLPIPSSLLPPENLIAHEEWTRYVGRLQDHPVATFIEPVHLTSEVDRLPRAFLRCTSDDLGAGLGGDPIAPLAARAQAEGWLYRELAAPHDPQLIDPAGTANLLHELVLAM